MEGLKSIVGRPQHRKELVAGGLAEHLTTGTSNSFLTSRAAPTFFLEYSNLVERLGNRASDFWSAYMQNMRDRVFLPVRLLKLPLIELPQVCLP